MSPEKIKEILNEETSSLSNKGFNVYDVNIHDGKYIAGCEFDSDAGEDFCFDIWFDGTWSDFVKNFLEYCENYDPDAHAEQYVNMRGKNGIPSTIRELINDADSIGEYLSNWASELWEKRGKYDDNWNKTAVNKCPVCGGWVTIKSQVEVAYSLCENDGELLTEIGDIVDRVHKKAPIEATCEDCNTILDCTYIDAEKKEFTFRAEVEDES